jgi:hypothetical protein
MWTLYSYLREEGCEAPRLLFEAKRSPQATMFGKHSFRAKTDKKPAFLVSDYS